MSKQTEEAPIVQELQKQVETVLADKGEIVYAVAGEEVKLSFPIVRKFLVKGNADKVSDSDLVQFISLCRYNQVNPFLKEAYLIKYGDDAQMIVSKEAFMKRAEEHPEYDGFKAGVIVVREGKIVEEEGSFYLPEDRLVGGWAEVYRKDKPNPYKSRVTLVEYDTKKSVWAGKPATMIRKVPLVQALREAFPTQLGAIYTSEEIDVVEGEFEDMTGKVREAAKAGKEQRQTISIDPPAQAPAQTVKSSMGADVDPNTGEVIKDAPVVQEAPPAKKQQAAKQPVKQPEKAPEPEPLPEVSLSDDDNDLPELDND